MFPFVIWIKISVGCRVKSNKSKLLFGSLEGFLIIKILMLHFQYFISLLHFPALHFLSFVFKAPVYFGIEKYSVFSGINAIENNC